MSVGIKKTIYGMIAFLMIVVSMIIGLGLTGNLERFWNTSIEAPIVTTSQTAETTTQEKAVRPKTEKPERIRGVWIDFEQVLESVPENDEIDSIATNLDHILEDVVQSGFNTVFWTSSLSTDSSLNDEQAGLTSEIIRTETRVADVPALLRLHSLYTVAVLPLSAYCMNEDELIIDTEALTLFAQNCSSDAVLINAENIDFFAVETTPEANRLVPLVKDAIDILKTIDDGYEIGIWLPSDDPRSVLTADDLTTEESNDYFYIEPQKSMRDTTSNYEDTVAVWDEFGVESGSKIIFGQHADKLFAEKTWNDPQEVLLQIAVTEETQSGLGFAIRSYRFFEENKKESGTLLRKYLEDINPYNKNRDFEIYNHKSMIIKTDESRVSFVGGCNPSYPLTCNEKAVKLTKSGDFSSEFLLEIGENIFVFRHHDKEYTYTVYYEVEILRSVSPVTRISAPGGTTIQISCVALRKAAVHAVINNKTVTMQRSEFLIEDDREVSPNESSDFVSYFGSYTLPKSTTAEQNLGNIKVHASYNGLAKTLSGARIFVNALPPPTTLPPTTAPPTTTSPPATQTTGSTHTNESTSADQTTAPQQGSQLTPYAYAGVAGRSRMCEIVKNYSEAMSVGVLDNRAYPLTTPLLAGMFDYITGESEFGSYRYYTLASGKLVYREDVKVIENGYNLPLNTLSVLSVSSTGDLRIDLGMTWKVPFNFIVKGQNYVMSPNGREFGVTRFTGNSLEITFNHTQTTRGLVNPGGSNIISSAQWIQNTPQNSVTLVLNFKKAGLFYGYSFSYNEDGSLRIAIKNKPSTALSGYKIMLDAGHGGDDPGAICVLDTPATMRYERQLNLIIAKKVEERLKAQGATVFMTRTGNVSVSLETRRNQVRIRRPDMFISIHCDSFTNASAMGTSAFYYYAYSFPLADSIRKQLVDTYKTDVYASKPELHNRVDRKTNFYPFYVTRVEDCPSVLIEYGFVSNLTECLELQKESTQNKLADATVRGILDYIAAH